MAVVFRAAPVIVEVIARSRKAVEPLERGHQFRPVDSTDPCEVFEHGWDQVAVVLAFVDQPPPVRGDHDEAGFGAVYEVRPDPGEIRGTGEF